MGKNKGVLPQRSGTAGFMPACSELEPSDHCCWQVQLLCSHLSGISSTLKLSHDDSQPTSAGSHSSDTLASALIPVPERPQMPVHTAASLKPGDQEMSHQEKDSQVLSPGVMVDPRSQGQTFLMLA